MGKVTVVVVSGGAVVVVAGGLGATTKTGVGRNGAMKLTGALVVVVVDDRAGAPELIAGRGVGPGLAATGAPEITLTGAGAVVEVVVGGGRRTVALWPAGAVWIPLRTVPAAARDAITTTAIMLS
jgi:hypothetical protein